MLDAPSSEATSDYRHSITAWEKISLMGPEVIATVRRLGYSEQTKNLLAEKLGTSDNAACRKWVNQIMQELTQQCSAANNAGFKWGAGKGGGCLND